MTGKWLSVLRSTPSLQIPLSGRTDAQVDFGIIESYRALRGIDIVDCATTSGSARLELLPAKSSRTDVTAVPSAST